MKKKKIIIASLVVGAILLIAGAGTYAYWQLTKTQQDTNDIIAACLDFDLTNADNTNTGITLNNAWPMSDEEGLASTDNEYGFVVTNHCSEDVNYEIALERYTTENSLSSSSIVIGLDNNKVGILNTLEDREKEDNAATDSKLIGSATVSGNDSNTHNLKVWLDANAPVSEQGKTFSGKVYITGGQGIEKPSSSLQILSGDLDTVGSEVAIGEEHFYVIESDDNEVQLLAKYNLLVGENYFRSNSMSEQECTEMGGEYKGGKDSNCSVRSNIDSKVEGYNKQSINAMGYTCNTFIIYNTSDDYDDYSVYTTWDRGEIPNKDGQPIDFDTLDFEYYVNCAEDSEYYETAVVPFADDNYWLDNEYNLLPKYNAVSDYEFPYVYEKDATQNTIHTYVDHYKNILTSKYNIEIKEAKLMSVEQAIECGCSYGSCVNAYYWIWNTSYFLGSTWEGGTELISILSNGSYEDNMADSKQGVRPVIVLDKSKI